MLRTLGLAAMVFSCAGLGFSKSWELRKRGKSLRELLHLTGLLQGEIRYAATPLQEAFYALSQRTSGPFEQFFSQLFEKMGIRDGKELEELFRNCAKEQLEGTGLLKKDRERLAAFGGRLGYLDREMQLAAIGLYREELETECAQAEEEYRQKAKLCQSLGLLGGLFLLILLV